MLYGRVKVWVKFTHRFRVQVVFLDFMGCT